MTDSQIAAAFNEGRESVIGERPAESCPFYATSSCADAWHAGRAYETRRPSPYGVDKVTCGRGYSINVRDSIGHPRKAAAPTFRYVIDWQNGSSVPTVTRVDATR